MDPFASSVSPGPRVLVVDDDPGILLVMSHLLSTAGFRVEVAHGGRDALRALAAAPFDVVVLDLVMPGVSGWDVAEEMRRTGASARILLFSGLHEREADAGAGVWGFLPKPCTFDEAVRLCREAAAARPVAVAAGS